MGNAAGVRVTPFEPGDHIVYRSEQALGAWISVTVVTAMKIKDAKGIYHDAYTLSDTRRITWYGAGDEGAFWTYGTRIQAKYDGAYSELRTLKSQVAAEHGSGDVLDEWTKTFFA